MLRVFSHKNTAMKANVRLKLQTALARGALPESYVNVAKTRWLEDLPKLHLSAWIRALCDDRSNGAPPVADRVDHGCLKLVRSVTEA